MRLVTLTFWRRNHEKDDQNEKSSPIAHDQKKHFNNNFLQLLLVTVTVNVDDYFTATKRHETIDSLIHCCNSQRFENSILQLLKAPGAHSFRGERSPTSVAHFEVFGIAFLKVTCLWRWPLICKRDTHDTSACTARRLSYKTEQTAKYNVVVPSYIFSYIVWSPSCCLPFKYE